MSHWVLQGHKAVSIEVKLRHVSGIALSMSNTQDLDQRRGALQQVDFRVVGRGRGAQKSLFLVLSSQDLQQVFSLSYEMKTDKMTSEEVFLP